MNLVAQNESLDYNTLLREKFLKWQCRVRQIIMREDFGKPNNSIMPSVKLINSQEDLGHIITIISKDIPFSHVPEIMHMAKSVIDPMQRRDKAVQYFSSTYFQKHREFSDIITSTFSPNSFGALKIIKSKECLLIFEAYNQYFELFCEAKQLKKDDPFYISTWWHNSLFNPSLHPETIILSFNIDWSKSMERENF